MLILEVLMSFNFIVLEVSKGIWITNTESSVTIFTSSPDDL